MTTQEPIAQDTSKPVSGAVVERGAIYAALAKAQADMGKALKNAKNPHFRSSYADLSSVMDACLPSLNANGICVIQITGDDDRGRYVETILAHSSGQTVSCRTPLIVSKNDMQGYGSAVTYARRYGLMSMAGIAPDDDDGNAAAKAAPKNDGARAQRDQTPQQSEPSHDDLVDRAMRSIAGAETMEALEGVWKRIASHSQEITADQRVINAKDARKAALTPALADDEIPY